MTEYIACYSRSQAIADGVLIDVSEAAKEIGIKFPVALTSAVWGRCIEVPDGVDGQDQTGRLFDVLFLLLASIRSGPDGPTRSFAVLVKNDHLAPKSVKLKAVCGPGDDLRPVITVMFPEED